MDISKRSKLQTSLLAVDWPLLLFLVGVVGAKLYVKVAAIFIYGAWLCIKKIPGKSKILIPPAIFYLCMPLAGLCGAIFQHQAFNSSYLFAYAMGSVQWLMSAAVIILLYKSIVEKPEKLLATISALFILNLAISLAQLASIMVESGHLVPYWYFDQAEIYGVSTGDYIRGIFFNHSIHNAASSLLGILFFLRRRQMWMVMVCLFTLVLCTSNACNCILIVCLFVGFIIHPRKQHVFQSLKTLLVLGVLYAIVSPQNIRYSKGVFSKLAVKSEEPHSSETKHSPLLFIVPVSKDVLDNVPAALANFDDEIRANAPEAGMAKINPKVLQKMISKWYDSSYSGTPLDAYKGPGKIFAIRQLRAYSMSKLSRFLFGAGTGNFASKLALKRTGAGLEGQYPQRFISASADYLQGYFYTKMYVLGEPVGEHSVINIPDNAYAQLLGEYGLAGLLLALMYFIFFLKRMRGAMLPMLTGLVLLLGLWYWYEAMTLLVIFELLMLTEIFVPALSHE